MEYISDGGGYSKTEENKKNLYALKIKLLTNKFNKNKSNKNTIIKHLGDASNKLKLINKIYSNSNIEFKLYKSTNIQANLHKEKIAAQYNFFVTMIGFIDGILDNIIREINFELNFVDARTSKIPTNEELDKLYKKRDEFLEFRNLVFKDSFKYSKDTYPFCIDQAMKNYPGHKYFSQFFNDSFDNSYQVEFITAYNNGYKYHNKIDFEIVYKEYSNYLSQLFDLKEKLKNNEEKAKRK